MSEAQLNVAAAGKLEIAGPMGFKTVQALLAASRAPFSTQSQLEINLAGVTASDSAGLALLIEWCAWAKRDRKTLRFTNAPQQLIALAKISDVDALLPFVSEQR